METSPNLRVKRIATTVICLALFFIAFFLVLVLYFNDGTQRSAASTFGAQDKTDRMKVETVVTAVDPVKSELSIRLAPLPEGKYATTPDTSLLAKELRFYASLEGGKSDISIPKGRIPDSINGVVSLSGRVSDYPFDRHEADLYTFFANPKDENESIPLLLDFYGSIPGLNVDANFIPEKEFKSTEDYVGIRVNVSRSPVTKLFSIFIMLAMWIVAIAVLLMALAVLLVPRPVELGMFIYMGGLIFALPAVRNLQPGVPPIGALTDFLSFFWVELIVMVSLLIIFYCWLTRYQPKP